VTNVRWQLATLITAALVVPSLPLAAADHEYEQRVWFTWQKTNLDVLVAHVHDPLVAASIERAIELWKNGITELDPVLGAALSFRVYWLDSGAAPPPGFRTDILVVPQGFMAAQSLPVYNLGGPRCTAFAPMLVGWGSFLRVTAHEFGHCLGLSHVFNHGQEYKPSFDIMGDGDGPRCPSNLNVLVLQKVFSQQTGVVKIPASTYAQAASC
jgi:hypothetical protein